MNTIKKKSVIFIISGLGTGGAEMMLFKLISNIDKDKLDIKAIISLSKNNNELSYFKNIDIKIINYNFRNIIFIPYNFLRLIFYLRKSNVNIVHTWMYHADLIGGIASKFAGVKIVIWGIRNSYLSTLYNKKLTKYIVLLCSKLSYFIPNIILSNSENSAKDHIKIGYKKSIFRIIPNGFDLKKFNDNSTKINLRQLLDLDENAILISHIARYHPQKNHFGFVEAAHNIKILYPNIHFIMIGSNVDMNNTDLVRKINLLNLESNFHLLGLIENISDIISNFNYFVSTSYGEAFPNVIGEAMASNVICISTNVGDCAEIISKYGFITEDTSSLSISNSIFDALSMTNDEMNTMKKNAKERIQTKYNIINISNEYLKLYNSTF